MITTMTPPRRAATTCILSLLAVLLSTVIASAQLAKKSNAKLSTSLNPAEVQQGQDAEIQIVVDIDEGLHAQSNKPLSDNLIPFEVKLDANDSLTIGEAIFPEPEIHEYPALGKLSVYTGRVTIRVPINVKASMPPGPLKITGRAIYQICNDKMCFQPERPKFTIDANVIVPTAPLAASRVKPVATGSIFGINLTDDAYLLAFAGAFIVGMIFNVMPCVLPVVPLKAVGFYEVSQHNRAKSLMLGATFSAGLIASFAVLGLLVVALRFLNWGELFQHLWFRGAIIAILLAMAVSTFGVFTVNVPTAIYRWTPRHDTYVGNFLFGILTAALSTPCTFGMFVTLLTWALTQPAAIGMALITMVGVGMAFPYFLLSAFPEIARRLPRTGPWAELVKQMMAFLLLATAVYFARPFIDRLANSDVFWWLLFAIVAAAAIYLVVRTMQFAKRLAPRLVAVAIALALIIPSLVTARKLTYHPHDWVPFSEEAVARARASGKPVLIEFTADWCGNCHWVEAWALNDRGAVATLKEHQVVMIKADVTDGDEPAIPLLGELNPAGAIPLTAIYPPGKPDPVLLTGIYKAEDLRRAVQEAVKQSVASVAAGR
jgi:thiol:disulfide interchange protein